MIHGGCFVYVLLLGTISGASMSSIVGGKVAKPHSRPYMASLQFQGHHSCGGILIQEDFVLTAAHCLFPGRRDMTVVLGVQDISKKEKNQQQLKVAKFYRHPNFTAKLDYDIMLLKLGKKAKLNKYVKPIGVPKKDGKIPANVKCAVAGWGKTEPNGRASNVLKEATEMIQFESECQSLWKDSFSSQRMICTKFTKTSGGICKGDSGGPLICNNKLQGITSFTVENDCNNPKYPHVFTKVSFYISWIKKMMKK